MVSSASDYLHHVESAGRFSNGMTAPVSVCVCLRLMKVLPHPNELTLWFAISSLVIFLILVSSIRSVENKYADSKQAHAHVHSYEI